MKENASIPKNAILWLTTFCLAIVPAFAADPVDTRLQLKPDAGAPVVATLPDGEAFDILGESDLSREGISEIPAGWAAVRYSGPIYGYALNSTVGKDFTLKPGAMIRAAPTNDSQMFSIVGAGDTAEVVELAGDWSKVVFEKDMVLFVDLGEPTPVVEETPPPAPDVETTAPVAAVEPAPAEEPAPAPVEIAPAPLPPPPAPVPNPEIHATPRVFQGYLTRTRRILGAGPKLDYQLLDQRNKRIALLDLSALLLTDPIDRLEGMQVSVFGLLSKREGVKDVIIRVETIRLIN